MFFGGLLGLGEEFQGLGLRYLLKESRYLIFKRQNDRKMRRVFAWFSDFCMSLPYLCPILARTTRLSKDNSKIINSSFSQRVCVYGPLLEVKISAISCKLKATYVFVFVLSAILNASILEPKISTLYHVYDCDVQVTGCNSFQKTHRFHFFLRKVTVLNFYLAV